MLEVVFSDSAAGTMAVAIGHKGFLGGATSVIISDGTVSKEEIEKFQHQAEERERSGWENAIPLEGNRKDIVNLPLALSVGNISEAGICLERESALSLLLSILPDMASEIVTELLNTSRKNYATLLEKAQNGEPIRVWVGLDYKGSKIVRSLMMTPLMIAPLVAGLIWKLMMSQLFLAWNLKSATSFAML